MASKYVKGDQLGEGTFGDVYQASRRSDGLIVAVKRIKPENPLLGINFTALREIKYLKEVKHPNIVDLKDVFISGGVLHLVLEFCPYDLQKIIFDKSIVLHSQHHKAYLRMLLRGIECLHNNFILHRDLKPANLLVGDDGQLKLADFGLARSFGSPVTMTAAAVTRWYRAPELLFGAQYYSVGVDIWAVGCIFAEIILRTPLFPGDSDLEQMQKVFNVLGTPNEADWPGVNKLPGYISFETRESLKLSSLFRNASALDLLLKMLTLNPLKRINATQALKHPYFSEAPLPCEPADLPIPASVASSKPQPTGVNNKRERMDEAVDQDTKRVKTTF